MRHKTGGLTVNKTFKYYLSIWAIHLIFFNCAVFLVPLERGSSFWINYIFITISFLGQLLCSYIAISSQTHQKLFYNLPLISVSYMAVAATLAVGVLFMLLPFVPTFIGTLLCLAILSLSAVMLISVRFAAEKVNQTDRLVERDTAFMTNITASALSLISRAKTKEAEKLTEKVYQELRFSDTVSCPQLKDIEAEIETVFKDFKAAVCDGSTDLPQISTELSRLIADRNVQSRLLK